MAQFDLHSKCRIPCGGTEVLIKTPLQQSRHIIIARNGHVCLASYHSPSDLIQLFCPQFYKLDMLYQCPDGSFALAPPTHIVKEVLTILETAPDTCEHPVGVLTAENRDSWYETRKKLLLGEDYCVIRIVATLGDSPHPNPPPGAEEAILHWVGKFFLLPPIFKKNCHNHGWSWLGRKEIFQLNEATQRLELLVSLLLLVRQLPGLPDLSHSMALPTHVHASKTVQNLMHVSSYTKLFTVRCTLQCRSAGLHTEVLL